MCSTAVINKLLKCSKCLYNATAPYLDLSLRDLVQGSRRVTCAYIRATLAVSTTAFTLFLLNAQIFSWIRYPPSPADISRPGLSGISVFALLLVRPTSSQFDPSVKCCNAPVTPNTGLDDVRIQTSTIPHCFLANLCLQSPQPGLPATAA